MIRRAIVITVAALGLAGGIAAPVVMSAAPAAAMTHHFELSQR